MELNEEQLKENEEKVRTRIAEACARVHRDPAEVTLLAVSKKKPMADIQVLKSVGQKCFGENYVQELCAKYEEDPQLEWHMIGHLQRNKVKYIIDKVKMIHAVDTVALADQIEKEAAKKNITIPVLMEVNMAREESKWGFMEEEAEEAAKAIADHPHIVLHGLMTSAPFTDDPASNRPYFRKMKDLFETIKAEGYPGMVMDTLSMGMTGDFEIAVEEGATIVRIGTAIFGARDYTK